MTTFEMTVDEILETYFYDADPIDDLPGIQQAGLIAAFDDERHEDETRFWGWNGLSLRFSYCRGLRFSRKQLAILVYDSHEIYLWTFEDPSSFETGLLEIRSSFNRV
ncbi:MAG TPA: hypothetical protein VIA62_03650 [Thermoanaerobaculia bacterium]|jgi:hypothetical protein|nr:hypothetical protein [Thermoanaerobaculia bacterium]